MNKFYVIAALAALLGVAGCSKEVSKEAKPKSYLAKVMTVKGETGERSIKLPAVVEATEETQLSFQVPGKLAKLNVREGIDVKKGDVLARLERRNFANEVNQAQAEFDRANGDYKRAQSLAKQNVVSASQLEQLYSQREMASVQLDRARKNLEDTDLRAPYDAVVARVHVENFENINTQQIVVTLLDASTIDAKVQVPASIVIDSSTHNPINVVLELDAAPGILIPTKMREAQAQADVQTQTYAVRFSFVPPSELVILPGMTGTLTAQFNQTDVEEAFRVPSSAVIATAGKTFVWVVNKQTRAVAKRSVDVSSASGEYFVINEGLNVGDEIVSAGGQYLYEGAIVRPYKL